MLRLFLQPLGNFREFSPLIENKMFLKSILDLTGVLSFFVCQRQCTPFIIRFIAHCVNEKVIDTRSYEESLESANPIWPTAKIIEVKVLGWAYGEQCINFKCFPFYHSASGLFSAAFLIFHGVPVYLSRYLAWKDSQRLIQCGRHLGKVHLLLTLCYGIILILFRNVQETSGCHRKQLLLTSTHTMYNQTSYHYNYNRSQD